MSWFRLYCQSGKSANHFYNSEFLKRTHFIPIIHLANRSGDHILKSRDKIIKYIGHFFLILFLFNINIIFIFIIIYRPQQMHLAKFLSLLLTTLSN